MKLIAEKHKRKWLAIFALVFLFALSVSAQPDHDKKLAEANVLADEGYILIDKATAEGFQESFEKYQAANLIYRDIGNKLGIAKSFFSMGFNLSALGKKTEALEFYEQALPLFQELSDKRWEARTLNNMGLTYNELGENRKALEYLERSLPIRKTARDLHGEAVTVNAIGMIYAQLGEKETALKYYKNALILRSLPFMRNDKFNILGKARILNNIGNVYNELGNLQKALENLNRSLEFRKSGKDRVGEATTLNNIGLIYSDLNETQKALEQYNLSLAISEETGNQELKATNLNNIGSVYLDTGEYEKAFIFYQQALQISQTLKDKDSESNTLGNIGVLYASTGDNLKALEYYNQVLPMLRYLGKRNNEALMLNNLMRVWKVENNNQLALFYGKQSVNKYQELRQAIQRLDLETRKQYLKTIEKTYRDLADLLIETGRFAQAEQVLRMLKEEEYFDFVRRDADEIKTLNQRISLTEKEKVLIERYNKLADSIAEIEREFTELDKKKQKLNLTDEEQMRYAKLEQQLADANAAFKLFLEKELVAEFSKIPKEGIEYDRNLQAKLKKWGEGTVTLYTVVTENRYRVILTTPNVQIDGKTEISAVELNKKIFAYRDALQNITIDPRPLGKELYDILIKPIEKHLREAKAKTLVWSLDGTLRYIPISTLSPDGKTYLVEQYRNVITTPQTRDDISDTDTEWRALGVGVSEQQTITNPENPDEEIDFSPIPGTKEELMTIVRDEEKQGEKGILNGRRFLDKEFTINSLSESLSSKNTNGKRKFTAVHIASHFQLGSNWTNSFLLLGNGQILTLKELKNSPKLDFNDVELVTLSACDTAFTADSNGKEVDSLASVIQSKSGKAVLAALWAVADESTPLLMSEFYRLRKDNPKMTKAEAMQEVQNEFVTGKLKPSDEYIKKLDDYYKVIGVMDRGFKFDKTKPFLHPYFWSPFVLIGNWR